MSMEHLAELLHVDEVVIEHGSKGFAISVRLDHDWVATTVDHADLCKSINGKPVPRMHGVAEKLLHLTDKLGVGRKPPVETPPLPRYVPDYAYEQRGRQLQRSVLSEPISSPPPAADTQPAASVNMASRFHAIVAELNKVT